MEAIDQAVSGTDPFWWLVHKNPGNGCWVWLGSTSKVDGYGKYTVNASRNNGQRLNITPHKYSWMLANGREPKPGMHLDHLCKVRVCVRPDHLEEVTALENHRRKCRPFCKRGHPQNEVNRYVFQSKGKKRSRCKVCFSERLKCIKAGLKWTE